MGTTLLPYGFFLVLGVVLFFSTGVAGFVGAGFVGAGFVGAGVTVAVSFGVLPFRASAIVLNALNILSIVNIFFLRRLCFLTKMMS
jgi:hypothetical protein